MLANDELLQKIRSGALWTIAVVIVVATVVSLAQSYHGLIDWAADHRIYAPGSWFAPLSVDTFVIVGELTLFVSFIDRWPWRARIGAAVIAGIGLAASIAGNVGHVTHASWMDRVTFSVWPIAAAGSLAVGLHLLERILSDQPESQMHSQAAAVAPAPAPSPEPASNPAAELPARVTTTAPRDQAPAQRRRGRPPAIPAGEKEVLAAAAREYLVAAAANGGLPSGRQFAASHLGGDRRLATSLLAEFTPEKISNQNGEDQDARS